MTTYLVTNQTKWEAKEMTTKSNTLKLVGMRVLSIAVALLVLAPVAQASYNNEPFESERYYSGGTDGTFSLTYWGRGCPANNDRDDYVFRINVNRSFMGSDWKMFSNNSYYQRTPSGRVIYGYGLNTTFPYICVGSREFSPTWFPFRNWTTSGVQNNVYTWRR